MNLLIIHITGAIISFLLIFFASIALIKKSHKYYKFYLISIAVSGIFQVLTGVLIPSTNLLGVCLKLGVYIAPIMLVELILYTRVKELQKYLWQKS